MDDGSMVYLLKYKDFWPNREITEMEAVLMFPRLLLTFLESHLEMVPGKKQVGFDVKESLVFGAPIKISCEYFGIFWF